ncbi:YpoC family protein [Bacillus sp. SCS-153A]|uniref:YpoC family protein n=1 Tax=Rossellomorea sedimentorum TaxID=3115294 RepID=UPI0039068EE8
MENIICLSVPEQVQHPLFYQDVEEKVSINSLQPDPLHPVFSLEILYYNKLLDTLAPWENAAQIKEAEGEWHVLREKLNEVYTVRSAEKVNSLMKKAIGHFMMYLFWTNGMPAQPASWEKELQYMVVKPVNVGERLGFVMMQPALFHSYKQLDQLFIEQMKQYAKHQAIQKHR